MIRSNLYTLRAEDGTLLALIHDADDSAAIDRKYTYEKAHEIRNTVLAWVPVHNREAAYAEAAQLNLTD